MRITTIETIVPDLTLSRPFTFVRIHTDDYFDSVVDGPSILDHGRITAPTSPGLGIRLRDDFPTLTRHAITTKTIG